MSILTTEQIDMKYTIIEIKGTVPLALVKYVDGRVRFINKFLIPELQRYMHYQLRNKEVRNAQAVY